MIHSSAWVSPMAIIGENTSMWQNCVVQEGAVIGDDCKLGANVYIESGVRIGNRVKIKNNIALYSGVVIEDDVFLGPNCVFTNVINPRAFISRKDEFQATIVRQGATIGANATIVCGNTIGRFSLVGAGTVVTKDIGDYELVVGNPGRVIGHVCECGCRLVSSNKCSNCGKAYYMENGVLREEKIG